MQQEREQRDGHDSCVEHDLRGVAGPDPVLLELLAHPQPGCARRDDEAGVSARAQFGLNIAFHILFPTITIGLAWILVYFRARYERSRDTAWATLL